MNSRATSRPTGRCTGRRPGSHVRVTVASAARPRAGPAATRGRATLGGSAGAAFAAERHERWADKDMVLRDWIREENVRAWCELVSAGIGTSSTQGNS
jgi:hypothetical protein